MHATPGHAARLALAAVLALAPLAARAVDLAAEAPLGAATESPLRQLFLDVTGADARLPTGPRLGARWVVSNSWTIPTTLVRGSEAAFLQLDGQADALVLSASAPWTSIWRSGVDAPVIGTVLRRLTTSIEGRATVWWGGWSDGLVEEWHFLMGFTNFQRGPYPRGEVRLTLDDRDGSAIDVRSDRLSLGGVALRNQLLLAQGGSSLRASAEPRSRWAVSLRLDLKLPIGSPSGLGSSGGTDVGAGLLATAELARWLVVHANVFTSAWGDMSRRVALEPRRFHHGAELSLAFAGPRWAVLVEDRVLSPIFPGDWERFGAEGYRALAASATFAAMRWHNQISVGVRGGPLTVWFSEDFTIGRSPGTDDWFFNSNAPDITLGVELAHGF